MTGLRRSGPLTGIRVLELAGMGPVPFAGMLMADMGADVVLLRPPTATARPEDRVVNRGRRSIRIDLKSDDGRALAQQLVRRADVLVEGYRPGVMERLGLGPKECSALNERLVYGRMSGWGQDGPKARLPGHDINYVGLTGTLNAFRRKGQRPTPHPGLVGDYGGGAVFAFGLVCALVHARATGRGQTVDASVVDAAALLSSAFWGLRAGGVWSDEPGTNFADTGSPFYDVYECADGRFLAVGPLEPAFFAELCTRLGLADVDAAVRRQYDPISWASRKAAFESLFRQRTRDEWCAVLEDTPACVSPVLTFDEAACHPHLVARGTYTVHDGVTQPAPSPRLSLTPGAIAGPAPGPEEHTDEAIGEWLAEWLPARESEPPNSR
jgi:alpha-methylacyl-CoA racemase